MVLDNKLDILLVLISSGFINVVGFKFVWLKERVINNMIKIICVVISEKFIEVSRCILRIFNRLILIIDVIINSGVGIVGNVLCKKMFKIK